MTPPKQQGEREVLDGLEEVEREFRDQAAYYERANERASGITNEVHREREQASTFGKHGAFDYAADRIAKFRATLLPVEQGDDCGKLRAKHFLANLAHDDDKEVNMESTPDQTPDTPAEETAPQEGGGDTGDGADESQQSGGESA